MITIGLSRGGRRDRASLAGLVWREDAGTEATVGGDAQLVDPSGAARTSPIDELGNFLFEDLPRGSYRLEIQLADRVVVAEDLPVGA
jgi:hypothetical protein